MGFIEFDFKGTNTNVIIQFERSVSTVIPALAEKLTFMMTKLQLKIQAQTTGRIRESIRDPRAEVVGSKITGKLDWGGPSTTVSYKTGKPIDFAQVLEFGARPHVIHPLTIKGSRAHQKGAKRRFGSDVLTFYSDKLGKKAFADYVFHPGIEGRHFVSSAIQGMKQEILEELIKTIKGVRKL